MSNFLDALQTGANEANIYEQNKKTFDSLIDELEDSLKTFFKSLSLEIALKTDYELPFSKNKLPVFPTNINELLDKKETGYKKIIIRNSQNKKNYCFLKYMFSSHVFPVTLKLSDSTMYCETPDDFKNTLINELALGSTVREINKLI